MGSLVRRCLGARLLRPGRQAAGSVTAETALALPVVTIVLAALLAAGSAVAAELRCLDAARAAARLAARGEPDDRTLAAAAQLAPGGARVEVAATGSTVAVTVAAQVRLPFGAGGLPVRAVAVGERELP